MSSAARLLLHVLGQDRAPCELPREGMLVIGCSASKAGLVLDAQGVSDVHCAIGRTKGGGWAVKDLGSEFGTIVNGERVSQAHLKHGDQLLIGSLRLEVRSDSTSVGTPTAAPRPAMETPPAPQKRAAKSTKRAPKIQGYRVVDRLGSGAMGEVYLALQESLDREVALKVLSKKLEADTMFVQSFQAEARAAAALNHPNVVTVHDVGEQDGVHYLTMEYMDRGSLEDRVSKQGPLHWRAALDALYDAASGLVYAESRGIVHRDIKPDNLMQNHTGATKIADLGLATRESEPNGPGESKIFGTPHFISPEQVRGEKADCRSDLYSLGATAFRLLTGHTPFEGGTTRDILRAKLTEDPAPLRRYVTDLPEGMVRVVDRLLRREPGDRYPSATALLKELDALRRGPEAAGVGAPPAGPSKLLKLAIPALLVIVAIALIPVLFGDDPQTPATTDGNGPTNPGDSSSEVVETSNDDPQGGNGGNGGTTAPIDDETQERLFEIEAENEFLKLAQRELDKPTRRDRLRELAQQYLGTTAAASAQDQADQLDAEILLEARAQLERDNLVGGALSALRAAAALDQRPLHVGSSLRAMAAVPEQAALLGDEAFVAARTQLENQVVAEALAELQAGVAQVELAESEGRFAQARDLLGTLLGRTDLPDFEEGRAPARCEEILALRVVLRARIDGLAGAEAEFASARERADLRAISRTLSGAAGLGSDLASLDLTSAAQRATQLASQLNSADHKLWAESLAADLGAADSAFGILVKEWEHWRRKSVPDPREARGATRETLGVSEEGLRLNVKGAVEQVPWSAFAGQTRSLSTLFKDRLDRSYSAEEVRAIAALLEFAALSEALRDAAEMRQANSGAVFTEREAQDLPSGFGIALEWDVDEERRARLEHELEAARVLADALRASSESDWTTAVAALEHLLAEFGDTLLVRLTSDGSLATAPR